MNSHIDKAKKVIISREKEIMPDFELETVCLEIYRENGEKVIITISGREIEVTE